MACKTWPWLALAIGLVAPRRNLYQEVSFPCLRSSFPGLIVLTAFWFNANIWQYRLVYEWSLSYYFDRGSIICVLIGVAVLSWRDSNWKQSVHRQWFARQRTAWCAPPNSIESDIWRMREPYLVHLRCSSGFDTTLKGFEDKRAEWTQTFVRQIFESTYEGAWRIEQFLISNFLHWSKHAHWSLFFYLDFS